MASPRSRVGEAASALRHELPVVTTLTKRQFYDPVGAVVPDFAVLRYVLDFIVAVSARSDHELSHPRIIVTMAVGRHGSEALVDVIVSRDDD